MNGIKNLLTLPIYVIIFPFVKNTLSHGFEKYYGYKILNNYDLMLDYVKAECIFWYN